MLEIENRPRSPHRPVLSQSGSISPATPNSLQREAVSLCQSTFSRKNPRATSLALLLPDSSVNVTGAGSGIRTHEGVTPNGCHVTGQPCPYGISRPSL